MKKFICLLCALLVLCSCSFAFAQDNTSQKVAIYPFPATVTESFGKTTEEWLADNNKPLLVSSLIYDISIAASPASPQFATGVPIIIVENEAFIGVRLETPDKGVYVMYTPGTQLALYQFVPVDCTDVDFLNEYVAGDTTISVAQSAYPWDLSLEAVYAQAKMLYEQTNASNTPAE